MSPIATNSPASPPKPAHQVIKPSDPITDVKPDLDVKSTPFSYDARGQSSIFISLQRRVVSNRDSLGISPLSFP